MAKSESLQVLIVIPARHASVRFPGKPLAPILGKPMIQHVFERSRQAENAVKVVVATEDERIVPVRTASPKSPPTSRPTSISTFRATSR
jgi:CMP-2-keto-3-deoxyoctulosonic acid synthetase